MARIVQKLVPLPKLRKRWSASRFVLDRMVRDGQLPTVRIGRRRFVHLDTIEEIESAGKPRCAGERRIEEPARPPKPASSAASKATLPECCPDSGSNDAR